MTKLKNRTARTSHFQTILIKQQQGQIDAPITAKEIHDEISKLKNKKASPADTILNEMIKHGRYYLPHAFSRENIQRHN